MENFADITRTISGKGVIKIPPEWKDALSVFLYVQLIRDVKTPSKNLTFNPDKGFYAHVTFCIDDYVLYSLDVNFKEQAFEIFDGQSAQDLLSLICAYDGILDSFVSIGNVVGVVISRINLIKKHPYLQFRPNVIRFECFSTCALVLTLKGVKYAKCGPEDGEPTPPPPPPPKIPEIPPGTGTGVTPPYPDDPGKDTDPAPIDEPEEPPIPPCTPFRVTITAVKGTVDPVTVVFESICYSPIDPVAIATCDVNGDSFSSSVGIRCGGTDRTGCIHATATYEPFGGASGGGSDADCYRDPVLVSIAPIV